MDNQNATIISGFPGVGKSTFARRHPDTVLDLDSSKFSKSKNFPENYIQAIIAADRLNYYEYILVSTHEQVREAMTANNISYLSIFPSIELKELYLEQYKLRGDSPEFIDFMDKNFETFIEQLVSDDAPIVELDLYGDEYLEEAIENDRLEEAVIAYRLSTFTKEEWEFLLYDMDMDNGRI